jgi:CBS domain-containing protein
MYEFLDYCVEHVMSRPVAVGPEASLAEVEQVLEKSHFNTLPVVDAQGQLVGVVTTLDLLKAFAFGPDSMIPPYGEIMRRPVTTVMSRDPVTVPPRQPLARSLEKMLKTRNKSFPVVDDGRLVGVVAREDVMRALRRAAAGERLEGSPDQFSGRGISILGSRGCLSFRRTDDVRECWDMSELRDEIRLSRLAYFIGLAKKGKKVRVEVDLRKQRVAQRVHPDETDDMTGDADLYLLIGDFLCESEGQTSTISKIYVYGAMSESVVAGRVNSGVANERLKMDYQRLKDAKIAFEEKYF